jgi:hypothetical protein
LEEISQFIRLYCIDVGIKSKMIFGLGHPDGLRRIAGRGLMTNATGGFTKHDFTK